MRRQSSSSSLQPPILAAPMFLRMPAVVRLTGLGRSTIYRLMAESKFPRSVRLADRAVAWRQSDVDRWSEGRPSAQ